MLLVQRRAAAISRRASISTSSVSQSIHHYGSGSGVVTGLPSVAGGVPSGLSVLRLCAGSRRAIRRGDVLSTLGPASFLGMSPALMNSVVRGFASVPSGPGTTTTTSSTSATAALSNPPEDTNTTPQGVSSSSSAAAAAASSTLAEQLRSLSPEDQELILNALRQPTEQKASKMGGPGIGPAGAEMVAAFTCGQCDFRMVKRFSKHAYTKGIVVVECPQCEVKHLLADHLGWWQDDNAGKTIEDILREKGESFVHLGGGDYQALDSNDTTTTTTATTTTTTTNNSNNNSNTTTTENN